MAHPITAVVQRREALNGPRRTAAARNVRAVEQFSAQEAPDPIRQGDTPAKWSRQQIVTFLSVASIKAVMRDDFWISQLAPNPQAQTLRGHQAPWGERTNIHKRQAEAYGSLVTLNPPDPNAQILFP